MSDDGASDLQLEDDRSFEARSARVARGLWIGLLSLMALALLGVFGRGPASAAVAQSASRTVEVHYDRFLRFGSSAVVSMHTRPSDGEPLTLTLDLEYLESFHLDGVHPEPEATVFTRDGVTYRFALAEGAPGRIRFELQPDRVGRLAGRLDTGGEAIRWSQFVYP